jgi:hypothetical protein
LKAIFAKMSILGEYVNFSVKPGIVECVGTWLTIPGRRGIIGDQCRIIVYYQVVSELTLCYGLPGGLLYG